MTTKLSLVLASLILPLASPALAHRPYEHPAGEVKRRDGTQITIVNCYTDGIIGTDPVSVQFRLPDGTILAKTDPTYDVAIRHPEPEIVEVYQFNGTFIPIAHRVQRFDGYALSDVPSTALGSALVHTIHNSLAYTITLASAVLLIAIWISARWIPSRGWLAAARVVALGFATIGTVYYLLVIAMAPLSLPILLALGFICFLLYISLRRAFTRHRVANTT
jgi:hypothetical protein